MSPYLPGIARRISKGIKDPPKEPAYPNAGSEVRVLQSGEENSVENIRVLTRSEARKTTTKSYSP